MPDKSEIIVGPEKASPEPKYAAEARSPSRDLIEIAVVFIFILAAVWTPQGQLNEFFSLSAAGLRARDCLRRPIDIA